MLKKLVIGFGAICLLAGMALCFYYPALNNDLRADIFITSGIIFIATLMIGGVPMIKNSWTKKMIICLGSLILSMSLLMLFATRIDPSLFKILFGTGIICFSVMVIIAAATRANLPCGTKIMIACFIGFVFIPLSLFIIIGM